MWLGFAVAALWFSLVGVGFVVMASRWLVELLTGQGPDGPDQAAAALSLAAVAFGMSLAAFATISLPGFFFVAYTVKAFSSLARTSANRSR